MKKILIKNGIVITVDPADTVWQKGWILVNGDTIEALGEGEAPAAEDDWQIIDPETRRCCPVSWTSTHTCAVRCSRA